MSSPIQSSPIKTITGHSPDANTGHDTKAEICPHIFLAAGTSHETRIKAARMFFPSGCSYVLSIVNLIPIHLQSALNSDLFYVN